MYTVKFVYSRHLWTKKNCPDYRGVLISEVHLYTLYIAMGPQLTVLIIEVSLFQSVLIIEVSLFQSVHNSRFHYTCNRID